MSRFAVAIVALVVAVAAAQMPVSAPNAFSAWVNKPAFSSSSYYDAILTVDDWVFAATDYFITAVNASTGATIWTRNITYTNTFTLRYMNGNILYYSAGYQMGLLAATTGDTVWMANRSSWNSYAPIFLPDNSSAYVFSSYNVDIVNLVTGNISTNYTLTSSSLYAQPIYAPANDTWVLILPTGSYLIALTANGTEAYKTYNSNSWSVGPVYANGTIFGGSYYNIFACNASTGATIWSNSSVATNTPSSLTPYWTTTGSLMIAITMGSYLVTLDGLTGYQAVRVQTSQQNTMILLTTWISATNATLFIADSSNNFFRYDLLTSTWVWSNICQWYSCSVSSGSFSGMIYNGSFFVTTYGAPTYSIWYDYYVLGLDINTGNFTVQFRLDYSIRAWSYNAVQGSIIVGDSYSTLTSILVRDALTANSTAINYDASINQVVTWMNTMYFSSGSNVYAVGINGTKLWTYTATNTLRTSSVPVIGNNKLYLVDSSSNIVVLNVYTGALIKLVSTTTVMSGTVSCTYATVYAISLDTSETIPNVLFSGSSYCVYMLPTDTNTLVAFAPSSSSSYSPTFSYSYPVVATKNMVYALDSGLYMWAFSKITKTKIWSTYGTTGPVSSFSLWGTPSGVVVLDSDIYIGTSSYLYAIGTTLGTKDWQLYNAASTITPFSFYEYIYAFTNNGNVSRYEPGIWIGTGTIGGAKRSFTTIFNVGARGGSGGLTSGMSGVPAISPDGIMVFASYYGVHAISYNGTIIWNNTDVSYTNCMNPYVYQGVVYVLCGGSSGQLILLDLYKGTTWLASSTEQAITSFVAVNKSIYTISAGTSSNSYLSALPLGNAQLYAPNELPAALPPRKLTLEELLQKNKAWIAGVVVGIIVIIIVVLVAKKLSGGGAKKDTDYVAMQNPVNTGV